MRAGKITVAVLPCPAQACRDGETPKPTSLTLAAESAGLAAGILTIEIPANILLTNPNFTV